MELLYELLPMNTKTRILSVLLIIIPLVSLQESIVSLCDDPVIHAADRLLNNTFRVYRGNYYWELEGLPDNVAIVKGPFQIWYQNMVPFTSNSVIYTIIGGTLNGYTFRYKAMRFWVYNQTGHLIQGDLNGVLFPASPLGGFEAAFSDQMMDGRAYPLTIAFKGPFVYYFNTYRQPVRRIGPPEGAPFGLFNESFPSNLTAAFAFPLRDGNAKYYVYLFRNDSYCYRPIIGEEGCQNWKKNKELFGCLSSPTTETSVTEDSFETQKIGLPPLPPPFLPEVFSPVFLSVSSSVVPPISLTEVTKTTEEYEYYDDYEDNDKSMAGSENKTKGNSGDSLKNHYLQNLFTLLFINLIINL